MDYIDTGLIIGSISTIVFLILTLKKRWFKDNALEDLYLWWDGKKHDGADLIFSIVLLFFYVVLAPFIIALTWGAVLPIGSIVFIVLKIRKRRINKNNRIFNN
tara:strand:- start:225 stop:533 length:309 start_codon:yes stop_codon:yes gene_type:complete